MATTTFDTVATPTADRATGTTKRPLLARFFDRVVDARTQEARRQIERMDPFYARLMNAPEHVREAYINSGRWHEQG
ncbi:hypothetical protein ACKTEK_10430 [Tepidamorphus sp. 3E244]|uniref:hypothetical protein n=1 Tax=Tepidamorphus sp. 3E244 TaxID=3385498 RepID=UPI0038FD2A42